ncbi:hypothetical protein D3C87_2157990 [compost metagenome]
MVRSIASWTSAGRLVDMPWTYHWMVSAPSGSRKTGCVSLSGKRTTLSSMLGQ